MTGSVSEQPYGYHQNQMTNYDYEGGHSGGYGYDYGYSYGGYGYGDYDHWDDDNNWDDDDHSDHSDHNDHSDQDDHSDLNDLWDGVRDGVQFGLGHCSVGYGFAGWSFSCGDD